MHDLIRRNRGTPEPNDFDRFLNVIKSALTVVGAVGAAAHPSLAPAFPIAAEVLNQVQNTVAGRRSKQLLDDVVEELYFIKKDRQLTDEQVQQVISSEQFNSALLRARLIATRTHRQEKLYALRNAVLNTGLGDESNDDRHEMFLSLIDTLTPAHLRILKSFDEPDKEGRTPLTVAIESLKLRVVGMETLGFKERRLLFEDLRRMGLLEITDNEEFIVAPKNRWTSTLGQDFMMFITSPEASNGK